MKNMIYKVETKQSKIIQKELEMDKNIYVVTINGRNLQNWNSFLDKMIDEFKLPMKEHKNVNAYLDWMRDLEWLDKEGYALFIKNYKDFMQGNLDIKKDIIDDFENYILPFWESEVEQVVVGGKAKKFNIYLVE